MTVSILYYRQPIKGDKGDIGERGSKGEKGEKGVNSEPKGILKINKIIRT